MPKALPLHHVPGLQNIVNPRLSSSLAGTINSKNISHDLAKFGLNEVDCKAYGDTVVDKMSL